MEDNKIINTKNLNRTIIILIIPIIIEMLLETVIGYVNVSMLGRLGKNYLAATEISNSLVFTCLVLANAFSLGGTVMVSKYMGARNEENRNKAIGQTISIGIVFSMLFYFLFHFYTKEFLQLMGAKNEEGAPVLSYALEYMSIYIFSIPILMFRQMFVGILRGIGKTKFPMYMSGLNIVLNLVLNIFFIYESFSIYGYTVPGLGMYLRGAALATLISRGISLILLILYFIKIAKFNITIKDFKLSPHIMKEILDIGLPTALEMMIFRMGMMVYLRIVTSLGSTSIAAHSVANAAESISYTPGNAFNVVIVTLVGQFLGAKRYDQAKECIKKTDKMAIIFMGSFGLLFLLVPFLFVNLFTDDKEVIALASKVLRIQALAQVFFARYYVYSGLMRTIGKSRQIFFVTTTSVWLIRLPLSYYFVFYTDLGLVGAWIGMCADFVYRAIFLTILTNKNVKKIFNGSLQNEKQKYFHFRRKKELSA